MADLDNRIPGRMLLNWVAKPLTTRDRCAGCGQEPAFVQMLMLVPPSAPAGSPDDSLVRATDALLERWLAEQHAGVFRMSEFEAIGRHCLASRAAQFMAKPALADDFLTFFVEDLFPDQLVAAMAIEPGEGGKTYPMVLGIPDPRSVGELCVVLNAPMGGIAASDEVIPCDQ